MVYTRIWLEILVLILSDRWPYYNEEITMSVYNTWTSDPNMPTLFGITESQLYTDLALPEMSTVQLLFTFMYVFMNNTWSAFTSCYILTQYLMLCWFLNVVETLLRIITFELLWLQTWWYLMSFYFVFLKMLKIKWIMSSLCSWW